MLLSNDEWCTVECRSEQKSSTRSSIPKQFIDWERRFRYKCPYPLSCWYWHTTAVRYHRIRLAVCSNFQLLCRLRANELGLRIDRCYLFPSILTCSAYQFLMLSPLISVLRSPSPALSCVTDTSRNDVCFPEAAARTGTVLRCRPTDKLDNGRFAL